MNVKPFAVLADMGHDNPGTHTPMPVFYSPLFFRTGGAGPERGQEVAWWVSEVPVPQELTSGFLTGLRSEAVETHRTTLKDTTGRPALTRLINTVNETPAVVSS